MTALILYVLLWLWDNRSFDSITKANERKLGAEKAYVDKKYLDAANLYNQITYGSLFSDPAARLNMAHSYFLAGKSELALKNYELLKRVDDRAIASVAYNQIALLQVSQQDTSAALGSLKIAMKLEPGNNLARTNFIVLRKNFSGQEMSSKNKQNQQPEFKDPNRSINTEAPKPVPEMQEAMASLKKEQLLQSLKEINMSEDQARAILDAMKSNESQYIYQLRRRQFAKKAEQNEKIEW